MKLFRLIPIAAPLVWSTLVHAVTASSGIDVVGWPLPDLNQEEPALSLGDDAVFGRQVCPPLTRLNLAKKDSEPLLVKKVVDEGHFWRLEPRSGIFWWTGAAVTAKDVAHFVDYSLPKAVEARGAGVWTLPEHKTTVEKDGTVQVHWTKTPAFGPFILNGLPFHRAVDGKATAGVKFECAGLYRPKQVTDASLVLEANPAYSFKKPLPALRLFTTEKAPKTGGERFELKYAEALPASPDKRAPDDLACSQTIDLTYATMIVWNTNKGPASDKTFRRLITQLIPVTDLASAGAGRLADGGPGLVPRTHPGNVAARKDGARYNLKTVSDGLNGIGLKRKTAASPRLGTDGKPLNLLFAVSPDSPGLVEKVIGDALTAVGIGVTFRPLATAGDGADGVLSTFSLDWPRVSFLGNFHSKAKIAAPFRSLGNDELDKKLEAYARTLTTGKPDFGLLGAIQTELQDLEPATVLLSHKACIAAGGSLKLGKRGVDARDPDWFRQLLF